MAIKVLLAGVGFEVIQVVTDVVEMTYSDVEIERARDIDTLAKKLSVENIFYDILFFDEQMLSDYIISKHLFSSDIAGDKIIVIHDPEDMREYPDYSEEFTYIAKPFSLDQLQEKIKDARTA